MMSLPVHPRLGSLLTLGLCLLALSCTGRRALTPHPPTVEPTPLANLLRDPDFSQQPSAWQTAGDSGASVTLGRDLAGFATLAVTPSPKGLSAGWSQAFPVVPGASYRVSYRAHSEGLVGYGDLRLSFYDGQGALLWQTGGMPASGDSPWRTYGWRCRAPADAVRCVASLGVTAGSTGRAAFDDLYLGLDDAPAVRALIVDYAQVLGRVRTFQQGDPACFAPGGEGPEAVVVPLDLAAVFPDPWADPAEPASYDLAGSDEALASATAGRAQVMVRLFDSADGGAARLEAGVWAEVAWHLAGHYNEAWASGYRYGICRWEVAGVEGLPPAEAYARLAATVEAFRAGDPELQVGGLGTIAADPGYLEGLLAYLAERDVSLGFVSWRSDYDGAPQAEAMVEDRLEELLDRYGLRAAEVVVSEWGRVPHATADDAPYQAARLVATLSYWQGTRLTLAFRSCSDPEPIGAQGELSAMGEAMRLLSRFDETPLRLLTRGGDDLGFALLAGKSEDGKKAWVAVADGGSSSREYRLALAGFPAGYQYTVREVAYECGSRIIASGSDEELADGILVMPWHSPAVHFIEVTWPGL